jgi:hypothetical protein
VHHIWCSFVNDLDMSMRVLGHVHACPWTCPCVFLSVFVYTHAYGHVCVWMYVCVYMCKFIHAYVHLCLCCVNMHMYVCIYIYIYIYILISGVIYAVNSWERRRDNCDYYLNRHRACRWVQTTTSCMYGHVYVCVCFQAAVLWAKIASLYTRTSACTCTRLKGILDQVKETMFGSFSRQFMSISDPLCIHLRVSLSAYTWFVYLHIHKFVCIHIHTEMRVYVCTYVRTRAFSAHCLWSLGSLVIPKSSRKHDKKPVHTYVHTHTHSCIHTYRHGMLENVFAQAR